jgi:exonuclease III
MDMTSLEYYKLGTKFCRKQYKNGGVCIFVHESIGFNVISTQHICKAKDLEICAFKIKLTKIKIVIITIYRSPTGNYNCFLRKLDSFLNVLYTKKNEYIICGDININYLHCHNRRQQLDTILVLYNLKSTVNFLMRIINCSSTAIDNIFIDLSSKFTINPHINGLLDHDAQLLK